MNIFTPPPTLPSPVWTENPPSLPPSPSNIEDSDLQENNDDGVNSFDFLSHISINNVNSVHEESKLYRECHLGREMQQYAIENDHSKCKFFT